MKTAARGCSYDSAVGRGGDSTPARRSVSAVVSSGQAVIENSTRNSSNEEYEAKLKEKLLQYKSQGVLSVVFGDIFLEDLRKYRENNLAQVGMKGIFPIWKRDTAELAHTFIDLDFKAVVTCVDSQSLDGKFVGKYFDNEFLSELPPKVDPCGENGEFHTFVYDGPIFGERIRFRRGKVVLRDNRFYFRDLIPFRKL